MKQVIYIRPQAPLKSPVGAPCNGCGVCCLVEPCPVGVLISRRLKGACKALVWSDQAGRYHCGLLVATSLNGTWVHRWWLRWARRMISAGSGCDASIEVGDQP